MQYKQLIVKCSRCLYRADLKFVTFSLWNTDAQDELNETGEFKSNIECPDCTRGTLTFIEAK